MNVPFLNLAAAYDELKPELETAILTSFHSGYYIGGRDVEVFEENFAAYTDAKHCIGVANGLDALHLALRAMDVGLGDEVIVPTNTYIATWLAVNQCGATPVPVEPLEHTYNIDPKRIESAITSRTRAIIPVHLYGQPAELNVILALAKKHGIRVLEDAAQAHGSRYEGKRIGSHGDVVSWSYYPGKNLGALGDAGALTTNNNAIADRLRSLRNYGSTQKYVNEEQGYNSRLDPVQAVALGVKLKVLDVWNQRRAKIAARYTTELACTSLTLPAVAPGAEPVWHLYVVQHSRRDAFQEALKSAGISTLIHYPIPPHLQGAYADAGFRPGQFPIAEKMAKRVLSLPIGPQMSDADVDSVITAVRHADGV